MTQRYTDVPRMPGLDYFEEEFASEQASLGGTQAARVTAELRESIHPNGLKLEWNCNCTRPHSILVDWHEVAAIAHNVSPSQQLPSLGGRTLSEDQWKETGVGPRKRFYPKVGPNGCIAGCPAPREVFLVKRDGERAMDQALHHGFTQTDPRWPLVQQVFNPARKAAGVPEI